MIISVEMRKTESLRKGIGVLINKLVSVFHASALLLIMNFVITFSKYCGSTWG